MTKTVTKTQQEIYEEADRAGVLAASETQPTPMIVGTPTTPLGTDIDYTKKTYFVPSGVCGFAWVNIKPARGKFVTWLKQHSIGRLDSYEGGWTIWVHEYGQSYELKMAYAGAFAQVLREHGIKAYASGRLD